MFREDLPDALSSYPRTQPNMPEAGGSRPTGARQKDNTSSRHSGPSLPRTGAPGACHPGRLAGRLIQPKDSPPTGGATSRSRPSPEKLHEPRRIRQIPGRPTQSHRGPQSGTTHGTITIPRLEHGWPPENRREAADHHYAVPLPPDPRGLPTL